ncbi:hypothetical protein CVIRNUC_009082 [Coccomyxa viridis]|uniref:Uncharacterized protein n=1 Tax=Coccomyxa viridis TaxID=1274662 RepID=A0AAV1IIQ2_9CHLO|nr:hypothetical protein CVIRNUC_009082 [Coccomyxa viridis]
MTSQDGQEATIMVHASAAASSNGRRTQGHEQHSKTHDPTYSQAELDQTDNMINHMILSYVACLVLGWGLLFFDWAINEVEKHPKAEPWISNAVTIGGASAVLSPIIQWGHAILYSRAAVSL